MAASLWLLDSDLIGDSRLASLKQQLGPDEHQRLKRFLRPMRAREFVLGRLLLRRAARDLLGPSAGRINVAEREHNSPAVSFPAFPSVPDFHFSLSHSRGWIACLASISCAVGLDIEEKMHARDIDELGAAAFDDAERHWLVGLQAQRRVEGFYRLWNNREALYKLHSNLHYEADPAMADAGLNCRAIDHPRLHIGVCAAHELTSLDVIELADL